MEGNVVSSSSTAFTTSYKHKLNCDRWNDDLCSNITFTKPWYRAEIRKLKAEVSKLEENFIKEDKQSFSTVHLNDILAKLIKKLSKEKRASLEGLDIKGKLNEDGEIDIKRLERFTGLCVHDISLKVEEEKGDVCLRRHHVHGSFRGIEFKTTFLVQENILQGDTHHTLPDQEGCLNLPQVISLDVSIENETANLNMKDFLQYVKEEKQLQEFFVTLQNYAKWKRDRLKTFNHFQNGYPELVTYTPLRDEAIMTVCNQQYPGLRVNIVWKVLVTREGHVRPSFDLQSSIPTDHLDDKDILRKMRSKFINLLKNQGIEKSIEVVIRTVAK